MASVATAALNGRLLWLVPLAAINAILLGPQLSEILTGHPEADWRIFQEAAARVAARGDLYAETGGYAYRWSPLVAAMFPAVGWIGIWGWRLLHIAAALSLPDKRMRVLALLAWPFWFDVATGNTLAFVLWFAAWALAGKRWAIIGTLVLAVLMPRPLVAPLVLWFLWREPWTRLPFVGLAVASLGFALATGWLEPWVARVLESGSEAGSIFNFGPSRVIGLWWMPIGAALGAWALWRGRPALAGLLVSPYWLPYYLLLPLAELAVRPNAHVEHGVARVRPLEPEHVQPLRVALRHVWPDQLLRRVVRDQGAAERRPIVRRDVLPDAPAARNLATRVDD
jgi:hypothetical protein